MSDLDRLRKYRKDLLLAESAAWLHDMGKCADEHIINQASDRPNSYSYQYKKDYSFLLNSAPSLNLIGESISMKALVEEARPKVVQDSKKSWILRTLGRCHGAAHIEKEEAAKSGKQLHSQTRLSNVFGFESEPLKSLAGKLEALPFSDLYNRKKFFQAVISAFSEAPGETRRPENEVTLWEWSSIVAALYKAALSGALTDYKPLPQDLNWRLLSIRFDGFSFFAQSAHLSDLLARRDLLIDILNKICELLEVEYPIGAEVYRDENGSIFVVPGCEKGKCDFDLLTIKDGSKSLQELIIDEVRESIEGELVPAIKIDKVPWWGQDPDYAQKRRKGLKPDDEMPPVSNHLQAVAAGSTPKWVSQQWERSGQICTVCSLRPQGLNEKAKDRAICDVCEQRRAKRSREWVTEKLNTTIWIDEVADANARIALITGCFDLDNWLSGDLVRTLTVLNPSDTQNKTADEVSKNPSFARMRRIWETTGGFWQDVCPTNDNRGLLDSLALQAVNEAGPRMEIRGKLHQKGGNANPGPYHAYDLTFPNGIKLSVAWDPEVGKSEESKGRLVSIDNLVYLASLANAKSPSIGEKETEKDYRLRLHKWAAEKIRELILPDNSRQALKIEESSGYGGKAKEWGEIAIECVEIILDSQYTPVIPILAEPRTFMALVPADKALDVARAIKEKYEREMGKVRNRLPLHLGLVYAHRRTPLRAILDAGRRMLDQKSLDDAGVWTVQKDVDEQTGELADKIKYLSEDSAQFSKWFAVPLINHHLNRKLTWHVPAVMGDGTTPDNWYPYLFWLKDHDGSTDPGIAKVPRKRYFQAENPWKDDSSGKLGWLVHAGDLKEGDCVCFTPATLDFQWLDSSGRRFEIAYDDKGQRRGLSRRPYLLDELEILNEIWETLKNHLTKNQIYILRDLIEARRVEWAKWADSERDFSKDGVFRRFCCDALCNADWQNGKGGKHVGKMPWGDGGDGRSTWLKPWTDYAARGWIADVVELHLQIMKEEI